MTLSRIGSGIILLTVSAFSLACGDRQVGVEDILPGAPEGFPLPPLDPVPLVLPYAPRPAGTLTFTREIAPIVFRNCTGCHGIQNPEAIQLTTLTEVRAQGQAIAASVASGAMPPWLPETGFASFAGQRELTPTQVGMVRQWVAEGMVEGNPEDILPIEPLPRPSFGVNAEASATDPDAVVIPFRWGATGTAAGAAATSTPEISAENSSEVPQQVAAVPAEPIYDSFILPVDMQAISILPDLGAMGSDLLLWALRPDGSRVWLLRIRAWDPAWRELYRFAAPIDLPRGSTIALSVIPGDGDSDPDAAARNSPIGQSSGAGLQLHVVPDPEGRQKLLEDLRARSAGG